MTANDDDLIRRGDAKGCMPAHWFHAPVYQNSAIAAINAIPAVRVEVKPLEWVDGDQCCVSKVCPLSGQSFTIAYEDGQYWPLSILELPGFKTKDDAITAVNNWRADRIRSALTPQPSPKQLAAQPDDVEALVEALREANGILEDALQEVGDDYPGSNCQAWCQQQVKEARAVLARVKGGEA